MMFQALGKSLCIRAGLMTAALVLNTIGAYARPASGTAHQPGSELNFRSPHLIWVNSKRSGGGSMPPPPPPRQPAPAPSPSGTRSGLPTVTSPPVRSGPASPRIGIGGFLKGIFGSK